MKDWAGSSPASEWFGPGMGTQGVWFFFVLSGFLITHLLLAEREKSGTVSIRDFYIRRILRIWPIYYLTVFLALVVVPQTGTTVDSHFSAGDDFFWQRLALYVLFLPQLAGNLYPPVAGASHLWSVGVEEMFYLVWPLLLKCCRPHIALIGAFAFIAIARLSAHLQLHWLHAAYVNLDLSFFFFVTIGASGAWIARFRPAWLRIFFWPLVQGAAYVITVANLALDLSYGRFSLPVYAMSYVIIILNVALNHRTWFRFENPWLKFLGDCSYGIYVYQFLCILLVVKVSQAMGVRSDALLYGGSIALTVGVAILSFQFFERPFLGLRKKFPGSTSFAGRADPVAPPTR